MADETLTLALHGDVSLDAFAVAIEHWRGLVDALTRQAGGADIQWVIEELSAGSATATIRAVSGREDAARPVVAAYVEVGQILREGNPQFLEPPVRADAVGLTALINGSVDFIRLETAEQDLVITRNYDELLKEALAPLAVSDPLPVAYGGVQGRIQTLTSRGALRFTLYDSLFDKAVNCYLTAGQEEIMRDVWGETAVVEGLITRDPDTGRPVNVREVWNVTPVRSVERFAYSEARGAITVRADDSRLPEDLITAARGA